MTGGDREEDGKEDKLPNTVEESRRALSRPHLRSRTGFRPTHHEGDRCHVAAKT